jgi:NADPH2:quinone reductase
VAFGIAGLAGWLALEYRAQVREGESVLVLGAGGVVGQVAVLAAMNVRGRLVQLGQSAGAEATIPSALIRGKTLDVLGHTNFAVPTEVKKQAYETMVGHAAAGRMEVEVERVALDGLPEVWERQRSSPGVKLVVVP